MSFIDVAIPAIIGLVALVWPHAIFYGSRATPDDKKIRLIRGGGVTHIGENMGDTATHVLMIEMK